MNIGDYRKRINELENLSIKIGGADYTERKKKSLLWYLRLAIRETQDDMVKYNNGRIEFKVAKDWGDKKETTNRWRSKDE